MFGVYYWAKFWYGEIIFFNCKSLMYQNSLNIFLNICYKFINWVCFLQSRKMLFSRSIILQIKDKTQSICNNKLSYNLYFNGRLKDFFVFFNLMNFFHEKKTLNRQKIVFFFRNNFFLCCRIKRRVTTIKNIRNSYIGKNTKHLNYRRFLPMLNLVSIYLKEKFLKNRIDFRKLETISIDPPGTLEIDDLIHYRYLETGTLHEIGLHTPDVHSIILNCQDFSINTKERFSSSFFFNEKVKLFPTVLSKNFLSLTQNADRLSFSSIFLFDHFGKIKKIKLSKGLIKNKRCFSEIKISKIYKKIKKSKTQIIIKRCFFTKKLILMKNLCLKLRSLRLKLKGNSRFLTNLEVSIDFTKLTQSGSITEELGILSNITMAEKILEFFPNCSNLRKIGSLNLSDFSRVFQISIFFSTKLNFSKFKKSIRDIQLLIKIKKKVQLSDTIYIFYKKLVKENVLFFDFKSKNNNNLSKINWGPIYLQTSSPIRRYGDIMAQKLFFEIKFKKII